MHASSFAPRTSMPVTVPVLAQSVGTCAGGGGVGTSGGAGAGGAGGFTAGVGSTCGARGECGWNACGGGGCSSGELHATSHTAARIPRRIYR